MGRRLNLCDDLAGFAIVVFISTVGAIAAGACALLLITFIGTKVFSDYRIYGVAVFIGMPGMVIIGGAAFVVLFRKLRSL